MCDFYQLHTKNKVLPFLPIENYSHPRIKKAFLRSLN